MRRALKFLVISNNKLKNFNFTINQMKKAKSKNLNRIDIVRIKNF